MRDDQARVADIIEACEQIVEHIGGDHDRFRTDPVIQAASQRWLEILGEASAGLSDEFKQAHAEVAWRDLVGMRNILAHGYFHVDDDILWAAVERDVPQLLVAMRAAQLPEG